MKAQSKRTEILFAADILDLVGCVFVSLVVAIERKREFCSRPVFFVFFVLFF